MTEFYNEHDCDCHVHPHKDPIEDLLMFVANYYTSLLTKLRNHINDASAGHVTAEEKDYWNNKADKISVRDLEEILVNLKNKVNNMEDTITSNLKQWIRNKKYVTEEDMTSYVTSLINKIVAGEVNLAGYAKESWVLEQIKKMTQPGGDLDLSKYALKTDVEELKNKLSNLETKVNNIDNRVTNVENKITNIENGGAGKNYEITNVTVTGLTLTITQNNMGSKSVTLPSGGNGGTTVNGVTKSEVESMLANAKTLIVTKNGKSYKSYNPFNSPSDITIDIVASGSTPGGDDGSTSRYQAFFLNTNNYDVAPAVPETGKGPTDYDSSDERSKWETNAKNPSKGYYTWMTFAYISNGVYGSWTDPVRITGKDGEAGTDTTDKEQIYKRAGEGESVSKPANEENTDDFVPSGWTDNPQGVTAEIPCEWTCVRTKNTETNKWSDWTEPVLWSHYGSNGTDGDGVEYIFWAGPNPQDYPSSEPNSWYTDEQSKNNEVSSTGSYWDEVGEETYRNSKYYNKREYIKENSGWKDDPIDLANSSYGPGSVQYVSMRKRRNDSDDQSSETEDAYWHQYSEPALWSYYAQDGDAGKGVSLNLDNGTMAVALNSNGTNLLFDQDCTARFYNGTSTVKIDTIDCLVYDGSGNKVSTDSNFYISTTDNAVDSNCKDIKVHIAAGLLNFNNGGLTIKVSAKANVTGEDTTRYATIQLIGVNFGEDGVSYRLGLDTSVVKISRGARYPSEVSVNLIKNKGDEPQEPIPVTLAITDSRWSFKYSIDSKTEQTLTSDTLSSTIINSAENTIRVELDFNGVLIDSQTIVFVQDGILGQNGISYSVDVQSDEVIGSYSGNDITYSGTVKFYVTKIGSYLDNSTGEYKPSSDKLGNDLVETKAYIGSVLSDEATVTYDSTTKLWTATVSGTSKAFLLVNVSEKSSGMFYTSAVVPFITPGKDGSAAAPLTLIGSPLRMLGTWKEGKEYFDGTIAASDGVKYQDIVIYNNKYYVCVNYEGLKAGNWLLTPVSTSYWQNMAVTEDFVVDKLAANQAYIEELSSKEVVITDNNSIVAGMTSGTKIKNSALSSDITKGNVRIWAGGFTGGNLSTAPFTVTDEGVVTSGTENKVILNNGTIYFAVNGTVWHLGITDGKPDWISSENLSNLGLYLLKYNSGTSPSTSTLAFANLVCDNNKNLYYSNYVNKTLANGDYLGAVLLDDLDEYGVLCTSASAYYVAPATLYKVYSFTNGVMTETDQYMYIGDDWSDDGSKIESISSRCVFYKLGSTSTNLAITAILDENYDQKWKDATFEDGSTLSGNIKEAIKTYTKTTFTSSQSAPSFIGVTNDEESKVIVKDFPFSNATGAKKVPVVSWDD